MPSLRCLVVLLLLAGCGKVKPGAGADGGGGSTERCEPGDALACEGDDLLVCGEDGETREVVVCDISCDQQELACTCEPGSQTCADGVESVCGDDGLADIRQCALGCFDDTRCADLDASNRLTQFLDEAVGGPDLVLPDGTIIDTNDQEIIVDGLPINVTPVLLEAPVDPGGIPVLVFAVSSLTITGDVITQGQPALAFVSDGDILLSGVIRSQAGDGTDGTGDGGGFVNCSADPPMATIGGQGGGGYGGRGGDGGSVNGGAAGGTGGGEVGNPEIVPLRGGGTNPSIQAAGGALQLVSRTGITFESGGGINAGGNAGSDNGSGGGAGGGILLEAPLVVLPSGGALAANGGGGGCGNTGTVTASAEAGRLDDQRAAGCQTDGTAGDGGRGGAGSSPNGTVGETISGCGVVAGSGGGGVGRIRINTADGTFAAEDGALVSPPASIGTVGTR
jgi:hypothetical protein